VNQQDGFEVQYIPVASSSVVGDSSWTTYQNDQYGFSVEYPPGLYNLTVSLPYILLDLESAPQGVNISSGGNMSDATKSSNGFIIDISVKPYNVTSSFDINQWLSSQAPGDNSDVYDVSPIIVDGQPGYEYGYIHEAGGGRPIVDVYHDGYVYEIEYNSTNIGTASDQEGLDILDEVVQHFNFTK
jgi:hypothetical protein